MATGARGAVLAIAIVSVAAAVVSCGTVGADGPTAASQVASPRSPAAPPATPGRPGEVVTAVEAAPPPDGRAWVVDYHSQDIDGHDVVERAMLTIPMTQPPAGGFPLIVWGHSSKGVADNCAPSLDGAASIPLVDDL